jgi:hypothetical protein
MRWEYYVHTIAAGGVFSQGNVNPVELVNILNFYGGQGWELVSAFDTNSGHGGTRLIVLTFKRPLDEVALAIPAR